MWGGKKKNLPWRSLLPQMPKAVSKLPHLSATTVHSVLGRNASENWGALFFKKKKILLTGVTEWHWIEHIQSFKKKSHYIPTLMWFQTCAGLIIQWKTKGEILKIVLVVLITMNHLLKRSKSKERFTQYFQWITTYISVCSSYNAIVCMDYFYDNFMVILSFWSLRASVCLLCNSMDKKWPA